MHACAHVHVYINTQIKSIPHASMMVQTEKLLYVSTGSLPLVLTSDVSPAGNHSVRIIASPGVEDIVSYIISDTAEPTGKEGMGTF